MRLQLPLHKVNDEKLILKTIVDLGLVEIQANLGHPNTDELAEQVFGRPRFVGIS